MQIYRSYTRLATGEPFTVEVEINLDELAQTLAARAIASKVGKSQALGGDIKCRVIPKGKGPL